MGFVTEENEQYIKQLINHLREYKLRTCEICCEPMRCHSRIICQTCWFELTAPVDLNNAFKSN